VIGVFYPNGSRTGGSGFVEGATRVELLRYHPAAELLHRFESDIMANVFRWTGHVPERTRQLLRHLQERANALEQVYPADKEADSLLA